MVTKTQPDFKSSRLKFYLAQLNFVVGDIEGNYQKILREYHLANQAQCDLIIFSEMAICGYPCEDLWLKEHFIKICQEKIFALSEITKNNNCAILIGAPVFDIEGQKKILRNSAILIDKGEIKNVIHKKTLPNYGVFDENRYFKPAKRISIIDFRNFDLAILICEDLWDERNLFLLREQVCDAVLVINASPYEREKTQQRLKIARNYAVNLQKPLIYLNQIGGQDALVFDGASFVLDNKGDIKLAMADFVEDRVQFFINKNCEIDLAENSGNHNDKIFSNNILEQNYNAIVLGLRDYVQKNNFTTIILGMSGGVDSALVAMIAVDALGSDKVKLYALPTKFNSANSLVDAKLCADNLQVDLAIINIENIFQNNLAEIAKCSEINIEISSLAQENLQSRIRGNILMALANSSNSLLITTGNKSEMSCGYATLYGDMNGAFNPVKDFYKTEIYDLVNFRNQNFCKISAFQKLNCIPQNIINKAPSAELRYNQKDSDSLPDYIILDKILYALIEEQKSIQEIINLGFADDLVKKVAQLIHVSEYKRRQAVIGVKTSKLSFDKERRYPITNKFIF